MHTKMYHRMGLEQELNSIISFSRRHLSSVCMKGQVSAYSSRPHLDIEQEESTRSCTFTLFYNDLSKNASNLLPIEAKRRDEFKRGRVSYSLIWPSCIKLQPLRTID